MSAATLHSPVTLSPVDHDGREAVDLIAALLRRTPSEPNEGTARLVGPDGRTVELPPEVHDVLARVVDAMQAGQAITVAPVSQRLTTSQAAEFLGISRPTLVKLLETHEIAFERTSRHRRVRLDDLLAYQERRTAQRQALLSDMTRQATADGLYSDAADDYTQALRRARQNQAGGSDT